MTINLTMRAFPIIATLLTFAWITPASATPDFIGPIVVTGKWVLDSKGHATPPKSFTRGLQTSGLVFRRGELLSIGDQRSLYPGHIFRLDPRTARLIGEPIQLQLPRASPDDPESFKTYRRIPNSDFEGVSVSPQNPDVLIAVTEDKTPWFAEIKLRSPQPSAQGEDTRGQATFSRLTDIQFPGGLTPWRDDSNFRLEGCTMSDDGTRVYVCFERTKDDLPRIYLIDRGAATKISTSLRLTKIPFPFKQVTRRADKPRARLNLNGLQYVRRGKREVLLAVARDQERILVLDLSNNSVTRVVDLDLRSPTGKPILWVSPEGIAADPTSDRLWVINDPDSVRGNYRARDTESAAGSFADYSPLLFELKLSVIGNGQKDPDVDEK